MSISPVSSVYDDEEVPNVQMMLYTPRRNPKENKYSNTTYMRRTQEHIKRYDWPLFNEKTSNLQDEMIQSQQKRKNAKAVQTANKQIRQ